MNGGITVVKLGGSLLEDAALRGAALRTIAERHESGDRVVLVHGGGKRIDAALASRGIPRRVHEGLRVTDAATLEVLVEVLAGDVNKSLVAQLRAMGVDAAGFSGADAGTLVAEIHPPVGGADLGFVGRVTASSPKLALALLRERILPVVCSVAAGPGGALLNVNADAAAAALSVSLRARRLVFLTDVEGLRDAEGRNVGRVGRAGAQALVATGVVSGGMKPKLAACFEAVAGGVREVRIAGPSLHARVLAGEEGGTLCVAS